MPRVPFALLLCLSLTACTTSNLATRIERLVDEAVAAPIAEQRFAGVVLVAREGRPVFRKAYGMADRERNIAHTPATPFMVMSVSKQFTAALIARLVVAGKLRLDDPVSKYLEHWPAEWNDVQVRHLLAHSSGLDIDTTYFWLIRHHPEYWPEAGEPPKYEPRALLAQPGTKYLYANVGYTLLSRIAAKAGGRPFDDLVRDEVVRPLRLTDTVPERDGRRVPGRARGYKRTDAGLELEEQKTIDIIGAGDFVTTADDLARFDAAFDGDHFLPAPLRDAMLAPHIEGARSASVGYGWFLRTTDGGHALQYHGGAGAGFRAFNSRMPKERLTVVVLSNVNENTSPWVLPLIDRIATVVR
ncbi:MAG TPA: serine hydrolase domain-containing protein [Thermoanaerobaculia bacterium]|nr:serine hydrolase domain-containing protein [Thermoanaerobaculia bacterium]